MIVLKAMTAYVQALNTKYMPNCDIFILSANSSFFMWGFWDFYVMSAILKFAFGINPGHNMIRNLVSGKWLAYWKKIRMLVFITFSRGDY